ncbi:glycosyltransferase [Acetobacterium wieringae]|uniref:N-acetylgalactosamine-N, N'-diacetylbacillosaminyl-diphospho-undecaprenol 4-alpha-N-acetylgalactosaminyltransferase n=1 Tax=Acetobacterium wieringae TaxID=52694 RepID=A0A1F2PKP8_9FIRM|nr:glycosyltransferase [Acetobacterium wieringae]OFV71342.1 N-acetylgalactosamine-N,N'-diacetylbacillosaminyl-diphospho-undecaprenol 4-alpha-N-acetylgalactosaminyltransferase [Acetobacterium wieringae]
MMKFLIVTQDMNIGGIQKSLLNLLNRISEENHNIQLRLFNKQGDYLGFLPSNVKVDDCGYFISAISDSKRDLLKNRNYIKLIVKIILMGFAKVTSPNFIYKMLFKLDKDKTEYDVAISFSQDNYTAVFSKGCNQYVTDYVTSNIKAAFIHSDIINESADIEDMRKKYRLMDAVINVSNSGKKTFDEIFPEYKSKSFVMKNLFNESEITKMANQSYGITNPEKSLKLVTVSRLSYLKGTDRILKLANKLKEIGFHDYVWHVVGEGTGEYESSRLRQWAKENNIDDKLIFVGNNPNPYPYIKNSDVFVFPTRTEAFPMVTIESLILNTPVVACRYSSVDEQITNNYNGLVIENNDDAFQQGLISLMSDGFRKIHDWTESLNSYSYENEKNYSEFNRIIGELEEKCRAHDRVDRK